MRAVVFSHETVNVEDGQYDRLQSHVTDVHFGSSTYILRMCGFPGNHVTWRRLSGDLVANDIQ